jgi:hypothetical protein
MDHLVAHDSFWGNWHEASKLPLSEPLERRLGPKPGRLLRLEAGRCWAAPAMVMSRLNGQFADPECPWTKELGGQIVHPPSLR